MAPAPAVSPQAVIPPPAYLAYRSGASLARAVPSTLVRPLSDASGRLGGRLMRGRRRQVERNLLRVRPELHGRELRAAVDATFETYARYWAESFRLPGTSTDVIAQDFTEEGFSHIRAAIDDGTGVILALPHLGGWEWGAFWLTGVKEIPVTAVAEALEPPELARWFVSLREAFGMEIIPLDAKAGPATIKALNDNRILCLVCDRDIGGGGIEVEFFGERTTLPGGPATLALRTGAPLLPTAVLFTETGHHAVIMPPLPTKREGKLRDDVVRVTQDLAHRLEDLIRLAPEQWHLLQPNWPSDPGYGA